MFEKLKTEKSKKIIYQIFSRNGGLNYALSDFWVEDCWKIYDNETIEVYSDFNISGHKYEKTLILEKDIFEKIETIIKNAPMLQSPSILDGETWFIRKYNKKEKTEFLGCIESSQYLDNLKELLNKYIPTHEK